MTQQQQRLATQGEAPKKGILSQLSMPAVVAAILTSITSFMLSSKLGLAGSLIGAALVSAVSTIASQLYNAMINSSVEKIHDLSDQMHTMVFDRLDAEMLPASPHVSRDAARVVRRSFAVAMAAALLALFVYSEVVDVATQGQGIGPTLTVQTQQSVEDQSAGETDQVEKPDEETEDDTAAEQEAADAADEPKADEVAADATPADGLLSDAGISQDAETTQDSATDTEQVADSSSEEAATEEPSSSSTAIAKEGTGASAPSAGTTV